MKKDLYTQERVSFRLEMQLRTWVDSQIDLQKTLAAQESEKYFEMKEKEDLHALEEEEEFKKEPEENKSKPSADVKVTLTTENRESISKEPAPSVVQRPLVSSQDHSSFRMNTVAATTISSSSPPSSSSSSSLPAPHCSPLISTVKEFPVTSVPTNMPRHELQAQGISVNARQEQWESFLCSPLSHPVTSKLTLPASSASTQQQEASNVKASLSPQQYRAILSSHQKPKGGEDKSINGVVSTPVSVSLSVPEDHVRYYSRRLPAGGMYYCDNTHRSSRSSISSSNYANNNFSRHTTAVNHQTSSANTPISHSSYSTYSSAASVERQNTKSRALKERMLKLKQESNKIRDDLKRFRSTMQEVREECTN